MLGENNRPVCPMCGELGIHPTAQQCIEALRAERDRLRTLAQRRIDPAVGWWPSYWP